MCSRRRSECAGPGEPALLRGTCAILPKGGRIATSAAVENGLASPYQRFRARALLRVSALPAERGSFAALRMTTPRPVRAHTARGGRAGASPQRGSGDAAVLWQHRARPRRRCTGPPAGPATTAASALRMTRICPLRARHGAARSRHSRCRAESKIPSVNARCRRSTE